MHWCAVIVDGLILDLVSCTDIARQATPPRRMRTFLCLRRRIGVRHGAQKTPLCRAFMEHMFIKEAFIPADCTDTISPVDKHVAQKIKLMMYERFDNHREWGDMTSENKRRLVTRWASEVWEEFTRDYQPLIVNAFVKCGFLVAKDGSENWRIQPQNNVKKDEQPGLLPDGSLYDLDTLSGSTK